MIGYITLGSNDLKTAGTFYDQVLAEIGASRLMEQDTKFIGYGTSPAAPMLGIFAPFNGEPAAPGNGITVALTAESQAKVDAVHKKALELGAEDEGAPGTRDDENFYGAYFRDMDGNKICIFHMTKPE